MKNKNFIKYILTFIFVMPILFGLFTSFRIFKYGGIEMSLKLIATVIILLISAAISLSGIYFVFKNKMKSMIALLVVGIVFSGANIYVSSLLGKVHETLTNISTKEETHHGAIVTMVADKYDSLDDLSGKKIGYFNLETSMEGYIIPTNILTEAGIKDKVTLVPFEDLQFMMNALYEGDVDAIMVSANYISTFENMTGFEDVGMKTMVLADKEETQETEISNEGTIEDLQEPFSILFMGVDTNTPSKNGTLTGNADALFLATVNPTNFSINITSIPRDSYVPIMCYGDKRRDKITHSNVGGTDCVVSTVANMFDIEIDYYIKINFQGLQDLVDAVGGIYVTVDEEKYPNGLVEQNGKRYYEAGYKWIYVPPGTNKVTGEQALAFARCRKKLDNGATERAANQTMVIDGIIKQLISLNGASNIYSILDAAGKNIQTNLSVDQMTSFYKLGLEILDRSKNLNLNSSMLIDYYLVSGYDRMIYHDSMEMMLYFYVPFEKSIESIKTAIHRNLGLLPYNIPTSFAYNQFEYYYKDRAVFYNYDEKRETFDVPDLVPNMNGYTLDEAISWAKSRGISYSINEIREGNESYNSHLANNTVISHNQKVGRKSSKVGSITFNVIKNDNAPAEPSFQGDFSTVEIKQGASYSIPTVTATDPKGNTLNVSHSITFDGNTVDKIDTSKIGTYTIEYSVTYNDKKYSVTKKVVVTGGTVTPSPTPSHTPTPTPGNPTSTPTTKPTPTPVTPTTPPATPTPPTPAPPTEAPTPVPPTEAPATVPPTEPSTNPTEGGENS